MSLKLRLMDMVYQLIGGEVSGGNNIDWICEDVDMNLLTVQGFNPRGRHLLPLDAAFIDDKIDDGIASSGSVVGYNGGSTDCMNNGNYDRSIKDEHVCIVLFKLSSDKERMALNENAECP